jgi:hypothetical protein
MSNTAGVLLEAGTAYPSQTSQFSAVFFCGICVAHFFSFLCCSVMCLFVVCFVLFRRDDQKWTIERNWQHMAHTKLNKNTTQYVLDTTTCKKTQIT